MRFITVTAATLPTVKAQAYLLRDEIKRQTTHAMGKSEAQSLWAKCLGYSDWNSLQATAIHAHKNALGKPAEIIKIGNVNALAQALIRLTQDMGLDLSTAKALTILSAVMSATEIQQYKEESGHAADSRTPIGWERDLFARHAVQKYVTRNKKPESDIDALFVENYMNINEFCEQLGRAISSDTGREGLTPTLYTLLLEHLKTAKPDIDRLPVNLSSFRLIGTLSKQQAEEMNLIFSDNQSTANDGIVFAHEALAYLCLGNFFHAIGKDILHIETNPERHITGDANYWIEPHWVNVTELRAQVSIRLSMAFSALFSNAKAPSNSFGVRLAAFR